MMITFEGRNNAIIQADKIKRHVSSVYPHVSESKSKIAINKYLKQMNYDFNSDKSRKLLDLRLENSCKINTMRYVLSDGINSLRNIIYTLKNIKIGNCYEEARLAEIIGKINGQDNIYSASLYFNKNQSNADMELDHVIAIITDKNLSNNYTYKLSNKDAIIIDSWLGIADYAGEYIKKLRYNFHGFFHDLYDNEFSTRRLANNSNSLSEYKKKVKEVVFKPNITVKLHSDSPVTQEEAQILRKEYPELVIENFKKISL